ncbi:MAG TPA: substrate-binding domain-containing protein [Lacunisphaera sp.]|nr:substrate-binding domain-containing protein [Lacunisphaera sp.]
MLAQARAEPACPEYTPGGKLVGEFHTMGSPTMDTITLGWIELFRDAHREIEDVTTMEARANTTVVTGLISGQSHVGPASRALFPSEKEAFVKKFGYEPTQILVCGGAYDRVGYSPALAIYVNEHNPLREITLAQLEELYAQDGKITRWGQLGLTGEWADKPIALHGLNLPNGIATFFQEAAMHSRDFRQGISTRATDRSSIVVVRALSGMVGAVGGDRYALCYAGAANAQPHTRMLAIAPSADRPAVTLTQQSVLDRSYPLSRYLYIYINRAPGKPVEAKVKEFLHIVLSRQGQELITRRSPLLPLPSEIVRKELAKID